MSAVRRVSSEAGAEGPGPLTDPGRSRRETGVRATLLGRESFVEKAGEEQPRGKPDGAKGQRCVKTWRSKTDVLGHKPGPRPVSAPMARGRCRQQPRALDSC